MLWPRLSAIAIGVEKSRIAGKSYDPPRREDKFKLQKLWRMGDVGVEKISIGACVGKRAAEFCTSASPQGPCYLACNDSRMIMLLDVVSFLPWPGWSCKQCRGRL